ncbi:hypothetical protein BJ546DRAFT_855781 [Cryomyces antarcticus]
MVNDPDSNMTLYFGYGSNLWLHQMARRCPDSTYKGIARLEGHRWIINKRGYANVVAVASVDGGAEGSSEEAEGKDVVYGLIYTLTPSDERRLDINEGVPESYTKHYLNVTFWPSTNASASSPRSPPARIHASADTGVAITALVYVDLHRTAPSEPRAEYVYRMNRGIDDALALGVPERWINKVLRPYIPADGEGEVHGIDGAGNSHGRKAGVGAGDGEGTATGKEGKAKGRGAGENAGTADTAAVREKAMQQAADFLSDRE